MLVELKPCSVVEDKEGKIERVPVIVQLWYSSCDSTTVLCKALYKSVVEESECKSDLCHWGYSSTNRWLKYIGGLLQNMCG